MVNLKLLEKRGITQDVLKQILSPDIKEGIILGVDDARIEKLKNFRQRLRNRILQGRENNITNQKVFHALDLAWESSFKQLSPTLLQSLLDHETDEKTVNDALKAWGFDLNEVIIEVEDPKSKKKVKRLNASAFTTIFVPIVKAYVTMRMAKIMNDRRLNPFFKFEPAIDTALTRLKCQAITSRIELMNRQYGYFNVVKQAVLQMLHYGTCLLFPMEEWHTEYQETDDEDGMTDDRTGAKVHIEKEGLRYHLPHPSRMYYDEAHRLSTFLTDTGCEYAGHWRVLRYKDVRTNNQFWNTDKISIGATDWWTQVGTITFFNTVYNGCAIKGPPVVQTTNQDRETKLAADLYTAALDDRPVLLTEHFEKIIPSEAGFGDYDYPVWFRFVIAQWDAILYAAPLGYAPVLSVGYDLDENRAVNASMSLECLPFQDHFSLLMSQYVLSIKQNLANIVFVDENVVGAGFIKMMQGWGEKLWRTINFFAFDGRKLLKSQLNIQQAIIPHKFELADTESIVRAMNIVLDTMERVLVMSSQEVAQAASHEQTREEVRAIKDSTSTRLTFTAGPVDDLRDAMKKQLYTADMQHGNSDILVQVPMDERLSRDTMLKWGFTVAEELEPQGHDRKIPVRVERTAIAYESFASSRDGADRINNVEGGTAMLQVISQLIMSPIAPSIGADQFISLINLSCQLLGFPREFKLENVTPAGAQPGEPGGQPGSDQQQQLMAIVKEVEQAIMPQIQNGMVPVMQQQKETSDALKQVIGHIEVEGQKTDEVAAALQKLQVVVANILKAASGAPQLPPPPNGPIPSPTPGPGVAPPPPSMAQSA